MLWEAIELIYRNLKIIELMPTISIEQIGCKNIQINKIRNHLKKKK